MEKGKSGSDLAFASFCKSLVAEGVGVATSAREAESSHRCRSSPSRRSMRLWILLVLYEWLRVALSRRIRCARKGAGCALALPRLGRAKRFWEATMAQPSCAAVVLSHCTFQILALPPLLPKLRAWRRRGTDCVGRWRGGIIANDEIQWQVCTPSLQMDAGKIHVAVHASTSIDACAGAGTPSAASSSSSSSSSSGPVDRAS